MKKTLQLLAVLPALLWFGSTLRAADSFDGLNLDLGNLCRVSSAQSRSISPENFTGEKGKGGMAIQRHRRPKARRANWARAGKFRRPCASPRTPTFTLADITGPGAIQQIWMTPAPLDKTRWFILRMYWDDETESVGRMSARRFFCLRHGEILPDQFAARLRESRQRVQLLLADAVPQEMQNHAGKSG